MLSRNYIVLTIMVLIYIMKLVTLYSIQKVKFITNLHEIHDSSMRIRYVRFIECRGILQRV